MPGPPRSFFAAIGATQESARAQILALGPDSLEASAPNVGDVLSWDGTSWVPVAGVGIGVSGGLIFRPGGTPGIGVVVAEADLQLAVAAYPGPATILFDDSITSPIHLTLPWTVSYGMRWIGKRLGSPTVVQMDDGFVLNGPSGRLGVTGIGNSLVLVSEGDLGPTPLSMSAVSDEFCIDGGSSLSSEGALPTVAIANGSTLSVVSQGSLGNGVNPVFGFVANSILSLRVEGFAVVTTGILRGSEVSAVAGFSIASANVVSVSVTNPDFAGTVTLTLGGQSEYLGYDDSVVSPTLGADNVQEAIDALKPIATGAGGSSAIWRGDGAPTAPGIFNTWADLFAWIQSAPGSKRVFLDSTYGPLEVPEGVWIATPPVEFVGSPTGSRTVLTLNEARFQNVWKWTRINFLVLNTLNVPFGGASGTMEFEDCAVDLSGGAQPFIRTVTSALDVTFRNMPVFPTTQLMFDMQPSAPACTVRIFDGTTVALNSFGTAVGTTLTLVQDATSVYTTQAFIFGTLIRQVEPSVYIPGNSSDWTFPGPTTVSEALDRLAAKFVSSSLGTP